MNLWKCSRYRQLLSLTQQTGALVPVDHVFQGALVPADQVFQAANLA